MLYRKRKHGAMVNRTYRADVRVRQLAPDHELGGFVVWADFDGDPATVEFLPVVGWALATECDSHGEELATILTVTYGPEGDFDLWDANGPPVDGFLGLSQEATPAARDAFVAIARQRYDRLVMRNRAAERIAVEAFGGPVS